MRPTLRGITIGDRTNSFGDMVCRKSIRIGVLDPERLPGSTPEYHIAPRWGRFYVGAKFRNDWLVSLGGDPCQRKWRKKKKELEQKQIYPTLGVGYNKVNGASNSFDFVI